MLMKKSEKERKLTERPEEVNAIVKKLKRRLHAEFSQFMETQNWRMSVGNRRLAKGTEEATSDVS